MAFYLYKFRYKLLIINNLTDYFLFEGIVLNLFFANKTFLTDSSIHFH
jgi:hypothetical protein